jgi:pyrrolidone-carboxylate peptidase
MEQLKFSVKLACFISSMTLVAFQTNALTSDVETQRLAMAQQQMPDVTQQLKQRVSVFAQQVKLAESYTTLTQLVIRHGTGLWQDAVKQMALSQQSDDRPLYWARLQMRQALYQALPFQTLLAEQQQKLLWRLELFTRGSEDIRYQSQTKKRILLTGFDPFFLDRHIDQSNPSGATALALDDFTFSINGQSVEVETLMIPVRFADFDQGIIETLLTPWMEQHRVDMVVTVSMGRDEFDLEHFPGLRRSAKAPDNQNVFTGASKQNPLIPKLHGQPLKGPEFVAFSLPYQQMQKAVGPWKIRDNRRVTTLAGEKTPDTLAELASEISVEGSGGGYLSNEISYRSILLRNRFDPLLPVGHIHTPRVTGYNDKTNHQIIEQIKAMLRLAATEI